MNISFDDARASLNTGTELGDLFPHMTTEDGERLKKWFCQAKHLPNIVARRNNALPQTGESCKWCQSVRLVWNGNCKLCLSCGESNGCS